MHYKVKDRLDGMLQSGENIIWLDQPKTGWTAKINSNGIFQYFWLIIPVLQFVPDILDGDVDSMFIFFGIVFLVVAVLFGRIWADKYKRDNMVYAITNYGRLLHVHKLINIRWNIIELGTINRIENYEEKYRMPSLKLFNESNKKVNKIQYEREIVNIEDKERLLDVLEKFQPYKVKVLRSEERLKLK